MKTINSDRLDLLIRSIVWGSVVLIGGHYLYCFSLLLYFGVILESIIPTPIFLIFMLGGIIGLISLKIKGIWQRIGQLVALVLCIMFWNWEHQTFRFPKFLFAYSLNLFWGIILFAAFFLTLIVQVLQGFQWIYLRLKLNKAFSASKRNFNRINVKGCIAFAISFLFIVVSQPVAEWIAQPRITREIILIDNNSNCHLCIWDHPPNLTTQIGNTTDIDLDNLTVDQNRYLTAFGRMHTTFYTSFDIGTPLTQNRTIAIIRTLSEFNLSIVWNIGYTSPYSGFISPAHPENWIANARRVLEFAISHNLTNMVGITADAEGGTDLPISDYNANIAKYDAFLQEVQTNSSLRHPDPEIGTFDTVLTVFEKWITDQIDSDSDFQTYEGALGLPPFSWTKRHYMLYRSLDSARYPVWLYNYLQILRKTQGTHNIAPLIGLTGCTWFCDGWLSDTHSTCSDYEYSHPSTNFDGIDGWDALIREIFMCKAFGFNEVSIFHLNQYGSGVIEEHGLLDYYGVDRIESLAEIWNTIGMNITIPLGTYTFKTSADDFFGDHGLIIMDILPNPEILIFQSCIYVITTIKIISNYRKLRKQDKGL